MDWIRAILVEHSALQAVVVLSLISVIGIGLGKIRFFGVSLGAAFIFFTGIVAGHFGLTVDPAMLAFTESFGLILFVFSIGLQVGPGFFSSFKQGGLQLVGCATAIVLLGVAVAYVIHVVTGTPIPTMVGVLSGAVTNTPGLAAAQQTITTMTAGAEQANIMASGYAAAYPLGVVGIILAMFVIKGIFGIKVQDEILEIEQDQESAPAQALHNHHRSNQQTRKRTYSAAAARCDTVQLCGFAYYE